MPERQCFIDERQRQAPDWAIDTGTGQHHSRSMRNPLLTKRNGRPRHPAAVIGLALGICILTAAAGSLFQNPTPPVRPATSITSTPDPSTPVERVGAPATTPTTSPTTVKPTSRKPAPKPTTKKPKPKPTTEEPEEVYYKNCTAVREAGADPIHRGDPGYGRHLDRDGDGTGCE